MTRSRSVINGPSCEVSPAYEPLRPLPLPSLRLTLLSGTIRDIGTTKSPTCSFFAQFPGSPQELRRHDRCGSAVSTQVLTSAEFANRTILYWMLETGIGTISSQRRSWAWSSAVIVSQALYTITNDHLPNYATLMAIGFSRWKLIGVVLIQAALLGIVGIVVGKRPVWARVAQLEPGVAHSAGHEPRSVWQRTGILVLLLFRRVVSFHAVGSQARSGGGFQKRRFGLWSLH